jgi:signal peptidase I
MKSKNKVKTKNNKFSFKKPLSLKSSMMFFGLIWLVTILVFLFYIVVGTNFFQTTVNEGQLQSDVWIIVLIVDILVGIGSFLVFVVLLTVKMMRKKDHKKQKKSLVRKLINFILFFIYLAILPIYLLIKIWKPKKFILFIKNIKRNLNKKTFVLFLKKSFISLPILLILLPIWAVGYFSVGTLTAEQLGLIAHNTSISGTGSMYPTFPKGEGKDPIELANQIVSTQGMFPYPNGLVLFGNRYFGHEIQRGDIVIVEDDKTRKITEEVYGDPSGWVKRVIAVGGDTLEIRDGIVYLNGEPQKEPYVARARSTFGESFLQECQQVTVPEKSVFVMGDNRTGSGDSREVGFFSIDDIDYALPWKNQEKDLSQNWHDTTNDLEESSRIKLNKEEYLEKLNKKREEEDLKPLKYNEKLEQSAQKRGEAILEYDDFSFEATASGYTMGKAIQEVGY